MWGARGRSGGPGCYPATEVTREAPRARLDEKVSRGGQSPGSLFPLNLDTWTVSETRGRSSLFVGRMHTHPALAMECLPRVGIQEEMPRVGQTQFSKSRQIWPHF